MKLLHGSVVLKLAALVAAVATYYFIHHELEVKEARLANDASYKLIKLTAKSLPVKVRFETQPPDGYQIDEARVITNPSQVTVIGPEALLDDAMTAETAIVDVSETTKSITKKIPLESVAGIHLTGQSPVVEVTVPIEKIAQQEGK